MDFDSDLGVREKVRGSVKWFSATKGYGFVVADAGGPDILLHINVLRSFGRNSITEGSSIEVLVLRTDRGAQAIEILSLEPLGMPAPLADLQALSPEELDAIPLEPARVKWFDKSKGFGFATSFGKADDIFVHIEVVRQSGLSELLAGEAICLKSVKGARGRMAVLLLGWDAALAS